ncbi:MAG TPA: HAD-IIIA family hydrolase [Acidimicrobiales bacterium]|nr:HAD-IIIA family hydrolase [Acidimicrobiales bacterium]
MDRDGVLNRRQEHGYVLHPSQLVPLDAIVPTLVQAWSHGSPVVVVSNQGCLSRRYLDSKTLEAIHQKLLDHLAGHHVQVTAIYVCPHHPAATEPADRRCGCRKPEPGLLVAAAADLAIDLSRSVFLGDQDTDRRAAEAAGIPSSHVWLVAPEVMTPDDSKRLADDVMAALTR